MLFDQRKIMVVAAHPDDEVLGVGATIHRMVHEWGCQVHVVILGEGLTARVDRDDRSAQASNLASHRDCIEQARHRLGYQSVGIHAFPDNRFDSVDLLDLIKTVEAEKHRFTPDYVFTHHAGDLNVDHRKTFEAVLTATRPLPGETVKGLFSFETFSATEWAFGLPESVFRPDMFIAVTNENLEAKQDAMERYVFERRDYPHPRSARALEIFARAHGSRCGAELVEAFETVRLMM